MKTVISSYEDAVNSAAEHIAQAIRSKPDAVIALMANESTQDLYSRTAKMFKSKAISFSRVTVLGVTEYAGTPPDAPHSSIHALKEQLLNQTDVKAENCRFLTDHNADSYDDLIAAAGGIDLAVVGIGDKAQLGFNSAGTEFETYTRLCALSADTKSELAREFGGEDAVPQQGMTMGIKTICRAKEIVVFAWGEEKADAVFKMLYARNDPATPAAFLQLSPAVTVYVDEAAATKL